MHLWKPVLRRLQVLRFAAGFGKCTMLDGGILGAGRKSGGTKYEGGVSCICICGGARRWEVRGEFASATAEGEMLVVYSKWIAAIYIAASLQAA